jgi:hypothetical protein
VQRINRRDRFLELIIAGRLAGACFRLYFDRGVDVSFDFATLCVNIECKRPLSAAGLEALIRKGGEQLERASKGLGIVAVSLSRIIVAGDPEAIATVLERGAIENFLNGRFNEIIQSIKHFLDGLTQLSQLR